MNPSPDTQDLIRLKALLQHKKGLFADDSFILQQPEKAVMELYRELKALQYEIAIREAQLTTAGNGS